ncbi:T9SS sorting signal type C domain-containing protein [Flavobacterium sp. RSSA_27]|uniref:T9SS sorting signal type C domain-containing protein n=1 Tax=Flavobacterium sp. RSSA_27 TaxID=3447667 RepID=UPI003F323360
MKRILFSALLFFMIGLVNAQATFTTSQTGNWNASTTWTLSSGTDSDGIPDADDNVIVDNKHVLNLTQNESCASLTINGSAGANTAILKINSSTLNVIGNISVPGAANSQVEMTTGVLNIGGNFNSGATFSAGAGTVNYNNTGAQTIGTYTYNNLTLSGSGVKTANGNLTVNGALTTANAVTLNMGTNQLLGSLTVLNNLGTIQTQNIATTPIPTGKSWGGSVEFNGIAQTVSTGTYNNLILSGSGTKTTTGVTVNGILSMEGTATASVVPTYGTAATLQYNTVTARTTGVEWPSTFSGTGGVVIKNTGVITLNNAKTMNTIFSIETSARVNLGIFTHYSNGLSLGGSSKAVGSWGSTSSVAPNTDNTFFAASTGILNVSSSTCVNNLITNGDFTNAATGFNLAVGWVFTPKKGTYVETYPEDTYFSTGNTGYTAELDAGASLRQTVTVVPGVSYTLSFIYARRNGSQAPSPSGVTVDVIQGTIVTSPLILGTTSSIPQIGAFTFTPTSASITLDFYNHLATNQTYGTIIDNIVLVPTSQVTPFATTIPKGIFNTLLSCVGTPVQLDVDNVPTSGVTYSWTGSSGATFSATNIKNPIVTFTLNGLNQATVTVTTAGGCVSSSTTYVNSTSTNGPTITTAATPAVVAAVCQSSSAQNTTLAYTTTTNSPTSYRIDWDTLADQASTSFTTGGSLTGIIVPAGTPAGTYSGTLIITNANCSSTKAITLTVNPLPQGSLTANGPFCSTGSGQLTWTATAGTGPFTVIYNDGVANRTVTNVVSGTPFATFTSPVTANTTYTLVSVTDANGCVRNTSFTSGSATISVTALPATPTVDTVINVTCSVLGSVVLSGLPANWTITQSGTTPATYSGTAPVHTVTGLGVGSYAFTVSSSGSPCVSLPTGSIAIADASSTTWNGTAWSNGFPDATKNAIINGPFTVGSNMTACALTINSGVVVTVPSGVTLTITNAVTTNGQLIFENNASLVQTTNVVNTGTIEYRRISAPMKNFDFTYWSSPVTGQNIVALSPNTLADKYFRYDPINGWLLHTGVMTPGEGYIIRVPKPGTTYPNGENWNTPTYAQPVAFKGVPNNGNYSFGVGTDQYNLIGNPYPSAIDADLFMTDPNNKSIIYGALYFWTHKTAITNNAYTADDYATYTLTGGVGTGVTTSPSGIAAPTRYIGAGQSFFVGNATAGSFQFTNAMRVAGNNTQFFKQDSTKKTTAIEKNRVWLNLTNSGGAFKQLLVGYITGATNDWDNLYDGPTFDGQEFVDFYSINQGQNLTIQGRALPFENTDEVPLGYRSTIAGTFDISIDTTDGALATQEIWLEDKKTNTLHELTKVKYTFTAIKGVENDRFVLKYTNKTLGTDDKEIADQSLVVSVKNKKITLISSADAIVQVQIFDLLGRKIYEKAKINAQEWSIATLPSSDQTLIVKTILANGAISNKKIVF